MTVAYRVLDNGLRARKNCVMLEPDSEKNVSVLIVDDDPDAVANLQALLTQLGYKTRGFVDPQEALQVANTSHFDAAVVDYRMPGINGLQLCQQLKQIAPHMSLALHSAYLPDDQEARCAPCAASLLAKPLDLEALISFVESAR